MSPPLNLRTTRLAALLATAFIGCSADPPPEPAARVLGPCWHRPDGAACDDGAACNGPEACRLGRCVNLGRWLDDGTACGDGDPCDGDDACQAGACVTAAPPVIDDGDACTDDGCTAERGVFHDPSLACAAPAGTDFVPGGQPLPIVIAGARWGDQVAGGQPAFITRETDEGFHVSLHAQAIDLAAQLGLAAGLADPFPIECVGAGCPAEATHAAGAPAIWLGTAADFADDPVVLAAFPEPHAVVPLAQRQRYVLAPAGASYYLIGATDRATDAALWDLLHELGYRHFAPGPAWEIPARLPSPAIVTASRDVTPRALYHGFLMQPDPQSGFGQGEWLRHNRLGDDAVRPLQGQAITGSNHNPDYPEGQRLSQVVGHWMPAWRSELADIYPGSHDCYQACLATATPADGPIVCANACLDAATVPAETLCAPVFPDWPAVTMQSADPQTQERIDDYFTDLAIAYFRAYPHADSFSLELSDRTTPCCDGGCCDATCTNADNNPSPGPATTDAYIGLANRVAARLRACPVELCPWNDPASPQRTLVQTALYNATHTPPTTTYDADVIATANLDNADRGSLEVAATQAPDSVVGYYGYQLFARGVLVDRFPSRAEDYLAQLASLDARIAPRTNQWVFFESARKALARAVQWQLAFAYVWGGDGTAATAAAARDDFFAMAFPEPAARERVRRLYAELETMEQTPSLEVLGRAYWHVAEARALVASCDPAVCGAPGEARYQRLLDRLDSLTLYVRGLELEYRRLDDHPHAGVFRWADAVIAGVDDAPIGEFLARTEAPVQGQGAALFDFGDHPAALLAYVDAHPGPIAPFTHDEIVAMEAAGCELYPAGWLAPDGGVPATPAFSDRLVAPPAGIPVACAIDGACGELVRPQATAPTTFQYFEYQVLLGSEPTLPWVVGLGESPGYFLQVWSDADQRWVDLFGARQVRSAPANCAPLDLTEAEVAEIATLANRRVRLLAGFSSNSVPGVCDVELWGASPLRAARTPVSPLSDANNNAVTTVQHFYVPPGLDHLDVYGLDGACLVDPTGATIAIGDARDGTCHFEADVPCPCADGAPLIDAQHRFVPGTFLREASIAIDPAAWGIWRMYKHPGTVNAMPMTFRNVPPYLATRAELLPLPAECVTADGLGVVDRCGQ
jgi:hypothetical protein